jgi:hypothetical protein
VKKNKSENRFFILNFKIWNSGQGNSKPRVSAMHQCLQTERSFGSQAIAQVYFIRAGRAIPTSIKLVNAMTTGKN